MDSPSSPDIEVVKSPKRQSILQQTQDYSGNDLFPFQIEGVSDDEGETASKLLALGAPFDDIKAKLQEILQV